MKTLTEESNDYHRSLWDEQYDYYNPKGKDNMAVFNYSNLETQAEEAKNTIKNRGMALLPGEYPCKLLKGELGLSRNKNDMITLTFLTRCPETPEMHRKELLLRTVLTTACQHQVDAFLSLMMDLNVDLSQVKQDRDWKDVFETLEDAGVKVVIRVWYKDDDLEEDGTPKKGAYCEKDVIAILSDVNGEAGTATGYGDTEAKPEKAPAKASKSVKAPDDDTEAEKKAAAKAKAEKAAAKRAAKEEAERKAAEAAQEKEAEDTTEADDDTDDETGEGAEDDDEADDDGDDW